MCRAFKHLSVLVRWRLRILVKVTIYVMKHLDQVNLGRKRFNLLTFPYNIIKSNKGMNSSRAQTVKQELLQRPWMGFDDGLALHAFAQPGLLQNPGPPAHE